MTLLLVTLLFATSCTKTQDTGFIGEWEGAIEIINSEGIFIESETDANITSKGEFSRECTIIARQLTLTFLAQEDENFLTYQNARITNLLDTMTQTYITGNAELVGDTLIKFDHEVFVKKKSSVISSEEFTFEVKRKE